MSALSLYDCTRETPLDALHKSLDILQFLREIINMVPRNDFQISGRALEGLCWILNLELNTLEDLMQELERIPSA